MKGRRVAYLVALAAIVLPVAGTAGLRAEPRGVIELFTSQGCSSCPAADRLLGELSHDPSLIPLTLAVDYWDYLGWKDTLARPKHFARQRAYAHARGDRAVYTPQAVINGLAHVRGSDRHAIEREIGSTRNKPGALMLPVKLAIDRDSVTVDVPAAAGLPASGEVWLCPVTKTVTVAIGRGENNGRTVVYHNVVRRWVKLGDWTGVARSYTVPTSEISAVGGDAAAVLVQAGTASAPGAVLGAAIASLK